MENTGLIQELRVQTNRKAEDIEADVASMDGVRSVECDPDSKVVSIKFDPTIVDENRIRQAAGGDLTDAETSGDGSPDQAIPSAGIETGYGGVNRGADSQARPPSSTI